MQLKQEIAKTEDRLRGHRDPQRGISRLQRPDGMRQHRHVAHRRSSEHQQVIEKYADLFLVQWEEMKTIFPNAICCGVL